jgi:hypothetical protein
VFGVALLAGSVAAAQFGVVVPDPNVRNASDVPVAFPDFGHKVLAVFYADADVADLNDPLVDAFRARHLNPELSGGVGVANLEDSKAPNFLIRAIIRGKNEKYETNILTDPDHSLPKAWGLGDCNNQSIVVIIDQTKTVRLVQRGAVRGADIEKIISLVEQLTGERDARSVLSAEAGAQP